jgi:hemolysin III
MEHQESWMPQRVGCSPTGGNKVPTAQLVRPRLRGRLHAVAATLSVGALVWLVRSAVSVEASVAAWIYGVAAVLCYLTSSAYHVIARSDRARALLRRADHSMIYVLIAGTFTPVCLLAMGGWWRWIIVAIVWLGALVGVALSVAPTRRLPRFRVALYLILGWAGVVALPALSRHPVRLALVVLAGLLYTVGAVLFGRQRPILRPTWFGYHEFWHCIGIAAGALLFVVNLSLVATRTP